MVVPSLEPETTYQFSVLAQNKLGTGPFSEVVTVNTLSEYAQHRNPIIKRLWQTHSKNHLKGCYLN